MTKRLVIITVLLFCSVLSHASEGIEESSLLTERAARSYQDMLDVRLIRALVVRNKTGYFFDGAQQRGITYELLKTFEKQINEELGTGNLPVYVSFVPVSRDNLIPFLLEGRGDVAAAI